MVTSESMARGCPVVAFDIKYGPREQIRSGVDGFLVEAGDQQAMAERILAMIDSPDLVRSLSVAAEASAEHRDHRAYLRDWQNVLTTVVENRASRLQGLQVRLQEQEITFPLGRFSVPAGSRVAQNRLGAAALSRWRPLRFRAALVVLGKLPPGALKDAQVTLDLISASEAVTPLSLRVRRRKRQIRVRSTFWLSEILAGRPSGDRELTLRLRMVVRNASWQTTAPLPYAVAPNGSIRPCPAR